SSADAVARTRWPACVRIRSSIRSTEGSSSTTRMRPRIPSLLTPTPEGDDPDVPCNDIVKPPFTLSGEFFHRFVLGVSGPEPVRQPGEALGLDAGVFSGRETGRGNPPNLAAEHAGGVGREIEVPESRRG